MKGRKTRWNSKRGSILVFLTGIIVSLAMVVTVLCETASGMAARSMTEAVTELASRSVLTSYHQELQKQYGLFGCVLNRGEMEEQFRFYVNGALQPDGNEKKLVRLDLETVSLDLTEHSLLNPDVLEHQILDYMKYRIAEVLFDDALVKETESLAVTEQAAQKLEPVYEAYEQVIEQKERLRPEWERWSRLYQKEELTDREQEKLLQLEEQLEGKLVQMAAQRENAYNEITRFEQWVDSTKADKGCDLTGLMELETSAREMKEELHAMGSLSVHSLSFQKEESDTAKARKKLKDKLAGIKNLFTGSEEGEAQKTLRTLRNDRAIQQLPSRLHGSQGSKWPEFSSLTDIHGMLLKGRNNIYVNQYVRDHFRNSVSGDQPDTFFQNELEYILFGDYSDKKNGSHARNQLFVLRSAINLTHICSNSQKRAEAATVAAILTPGPAAPVTKGILLALWAAAEAGSDVKRLLAGEKVPLLKTEADWRLSLEGAMAGKTDGGTDGGNQKGLDYEEYLMLFLLIKNREDKMVRIMDLIQLNMKSSSDGAFRIKDCYGGMGVRAEFVKESGFYSSGGSVWKRRGTVEQVHIY